MGLLLLPLLLPLNKRVVAEPRRADGGSRTRYKYLRRSAIAVTTRVPYSHTIYATYELVSLDEWWCTRHPREKCGRTLPIG